MNGHNQQGLEATEPTKEQWQEMNEWLSDDQAQLEYQLWLEYLEENDERTT